MNKLADTIIRYSFYLLFFLVPLIFYSGSFELFEYNKMMLTYALTIIIAAAWLFKLISNFKFQISNWLRSMRRTPLDIPIFLYLAAHIVSTIFSIDPHVSIWGYYGRFHEGLLATISYIILYYAAVSNLTRHDVLNILYSSFFSAVIVSLWGVLEHFGGSPSCLVISGKFDDACWIQDVKNRVFATIGQPNWLAAYLDILILTALGLLFRGKDRVFNLILIPLFFAALLFTKSRSGVLGLILGAATFFTAYLFLHRKSFKSIFQKPLLLLTASCLLLAAVFGLPFTQIENLNLEHFWQVKSGSVSQAPKIVNPEINISESGDIRRVVWTGAIKVWERYPLFGSGVETFAYAYYKDRPAAHNLLSEWDFLYNKAHNEFLNILATTGTVGFLSYLGILGVFTWWFLRYLITTSGARSANDYLISALFAAYISILVTNFFGFSVVIIGLFFFLIPAFSLILTNSYELQTTNPHPLASTSQWIAIGFVTLLGLILELNILNMWLADRSFAYGKNLDGVSQPLAGYSYLKDAVDTNPGEPTFRDELSYNEATLATLIYEELNAATNSGIASASPTQKINLIIPRLNLSVGDLIKNAVSDSDQVVETSPNSMPFWKTRTKVFYQLGTIDKNYLAQSLTAIAKAAKLAPTDAKVHYNYGLILAQAGQTKEAIKILEETAALKPDYRDAYYALGLYYSQLGDKAKARSEMEYILKHIGPDQEAQKFLSDPANQ